MKKILLKSIFVLCMMGALVGCTKNIDTKVSENLMAEIEKTEVDTKDKLNEENNKKIRVFSLEVFKKSLDTEGKNTMVSPVSVMYALAMTYNGADGETLQEFVDTLGLSMEDINGYAKAYKDALKVGENEINLANSIWIKENGGFTPNQDFLQINKNYYDAEIFKSPFDQKTVEDMNMWVDKNTQGRIKKIIEEIPENPIMYLLNAVAFKGKWETPYNPDETYEDNFKLEDSTEIKKEFMFEKLEQYIEGENEKGFIKDYKDGDYFFVALLPNEGTSIQDYILSLNGEKISSLIQGVKNEEVETLLPKFKSEYSLSLVNPLNNMGIKTGFSEENADFSKAGESAENIFISDVFHKTFIDLNEEGTEAAAVTGVTLGTESVAEEVNSVYLDRPFVYMIVDKTNKIPLFIGAFTGLEQE